MCVGLQNIIGEVHKKEEEEDLEVSALVDDALEQLMVLDEVVAVAHSRSAELEHCRLHVLSRRVLP